MAPVAPADQRTAMKLHTRIFTALVICAVIWIMAGCSVHVDDKNKDAKKVDIQTPFANLKVDTSSQSTDNGIPVYPGAKPREADKDGDTHRANVNIGGPNFGVKVVAAEFITPDSPDKVKSFYLDKLKKYGDVLECRGHSGEGYYKGDDDNDPKLTCDDAHGNGWQLKVGTKHNQHLVAIEPDSSGTRFGTVLVQIHGKEGTL
jgi:hypothetical protein